ncbi:MAG: 16S rRNA (adenine(1518)-N(6)/adenine(1519)-N(6))-dimethyltransferase RsmA, partial [Holosporales bacterium]|jgi:16S rRNA (adenine1518-N6/adenine1519-N6)-dimethyltransferase|nr:16S rRNA (adenine(1518)-N(6)/adenine(1519)-N(6))-dimethyltransferase RsmA [Holosporales bacterium]
MPSKITIHQIIKEYGILLNRGHAKSLGQHFLCNKTLLRKIVATALPFDESDIIEIGPGPGGLTIAISEVAGKSKIFAIEKDKNLKPLHGDLLKRLNCNIEFIYNDALKVSLNELTKNNITIIANLPYNVGTRLLVNWLLNIGRIKKMVLMFQTEVAERICAKVKTAQYSRLSVISQLICQTEKIFDISNKAFYPIPKVMSSIVRLTPKTVIDSETLLNLQRLISHAFQHRRKTIYSILKTYYKDYDIEKVIQACGIEKTNRPESISPEIFLKLSKMLH